MGGHDVFDAVDGMTDVMVVGIEADVVGGVVEHCGDDVALGVFCGM